MNALIVCGSISVIHNTPKADLGSELLWIKLHDGNQQLRQSF